jgi:hypothetical protein
LMIGLPILLSVVRKGGAKKKKKKKRIDRPVLVS